MNILVGLIVAILVFVILNLFIEAGLAGLIAAIVFLIYLFNGTNFRT